MDLLHKGWFTEFSPDDYEAVKNGEKRLDKEMMVNYQACGNAWPGQAFSLQVEEELFHERSQYQDILVFRSKTYGNVLVLDGILQCTERDEFAYQEMLAHLAMFSHPNPTKVLIIGGGDGGVLREVLKHDCVQSVTLCEIDEMVIDVSKKYLPHMSASFDSPKLNLFIGDGIEFLKKCKGEYDVVITDSSDPIGPATSLFSEDYYKLIKESLREGGILSSQGECPWLDLKFITQLRIICVKHFPISFYAINSVPTYASALMGYLLCSKEVCECIWLHAKLIKEMLQFISTVYASIYYACSFMPTYPCGAMGYFVASKEVLRDIRIPAREISDEQVKKMKLKYYNSNVHRASFVLPQFIKEVSNIAIILFLSHLSLLNLILSFLSKLN
ncbi:unnamed protein product [Dracunculus medinensis]|uniref:Spermidine synthase n=1 Tax=Dracunculus medinensis TaxID=318479 RepID=A0A0N4UPI2_DRAME|nr:unnamed protein product [Dracunculus medinensis]